ncbi:hypothetical protein KQI89_01570 [Clostridium sp. MSJ-4]|uniref:Transglutaminase-like domain-containing protein n=1 Tax=Clostridium simiarum TaxID=2841506 RepID=A0ABS6EW37_9CLOT|nr:transglutaminase domain-containing protein [Clostridium simiarum]MBU5590443.1 hypothetical protein [Clostridium simiarum]
MKSFSRKIILLGIIVVSFALFAFGCKNKVDKSKGLFVEKWDNIYMGTNIKFYNEDFSTSYLKSLSEDQGLFSKVEGATTDMDKSLKLLAWTHEMFTFNKGSESGKEDAKDIIDSLKDAKKASDKDMSIVFAQAVRTAGVYSRLGEFRVKDSQFYKKDSSLYVVEIWSKELNKWVMIDVAHKAYFSYEEVPLSAMEVLNRNIAELEVREVEKIEKYKKEMAKYLYSYSIPIDNNFVGIKKSNAYITYIPEGDMPELKSLNSYAGPSLYVNKVDMFQFSPTKEYVDDKSDDKATFILMKGEPSLDKLEELGFVVGAFKNSVMVKEYYVSINGSEYAKVNKYFDLAIKPGENTITLSEDGKTSVKEIKIQYKK